MWRKSPQMRSEASLGCTFGLERRSLMRLPMLRICSPLGVLDRLQILCCLRG